jgi:hypothetical protein
MAGMHAEAINTAKNFLAGLASGFWRKPLPFALCAQSSAMEEKFQALQWNCDFNEMFDISVP